MLKKIVIFAFLFLLSACSPQPNPSAIQTAIAQTQIALPTATHTPTLIPTETNTPTPTNTPQPTPTVTQTATKTFEPSQTPKPDEPIKYSGNGADVLALKGLWDGVAQLAISCECTSNFVVYGLNDSGSSKELLVNTIGKYSGRVLINYLKGQKIVRLEIKANGPWTVSALPIAAGYIKILQVPGTTTGESDYVLALLSNADTIKIKSAEKGNFVIYALTDITQKLVVNEIGPVEGKYLLPNNTLLLIIKATGPWTIDATAK